MLNWVCWQTVWNRSATMVSHLPYPFRHSAMSFALFSDFAIALWVNLPHTIQCRIMVRAIINLSGSFASIMPNVLVMHLNYVFFPVKPVVLELGKWRTSFVWYIVGILFSIEVGWSKKLGHKTLHLSKLTGCGLVGACNASFSALSQAVFTCLFFQSFFFLAGNFFSLIILIILWINVAVMSVCKGVYKLQCMNHP